MLRGVVRDGLIVINTYGEIPDGTPVDVVPVRARSKSKTGGKTVKAKATGRPMPGVGSWKHRTDIRDTAEFARKLRRRASRGEAIPATHAPP